MSKTPEAFVFVGKVEKLKSVKNSVSFCISLPLKIAKKLEKKSDVLGIAEGTVFEGKIAQSEGKALSLEIFSSSKVLGSLKEGEKISVEIFEVDREVLVPNDLLQALSKNQKALGTWESTTEKAKADWVLWFVAVKNEETRKKHISKAISMLQAGKKRVCCFGGRNWVLKAQK